MLNGEADPLVRCHGVESVHLGASSTAAGDGLDVFGTNAPSGGTASAAVATAAGGAGSDRRDVSSLTKKERCMCHHVEKRKLAKEEKRQAKQQQQGELGEDNSSGGDDNDDDDHDSDDNDTENDADSDAVHEFCAIVVLHYEYVSLHLFLFVWTMLTGECVSCTRCSCVHTAAASDQAVIQYMRSTRATTVLSLRGMPLLVPSAAILKYFFFGLLTIWTSK